LIIAVEFLLIVAAEASAVFIAHRRQRYIWGRHIVVRHIARNAILRIEIEHSHFHAGDFALIFLLLVLNPLFVIAVETLLVVSAQTTLPWVRTVGVIVLSLADHR